MKRSAVEILSDMNSKIADYFTDRPDREVIFNDMHMEKEHILVSVYPSRKIQDEIMMYLYS